MTHPAPQLFQDCAEACLSVDLLNLVDWSRFSIWRGTDRGQGLGHDLWPLTRFAFIPKSRKSWQQTKSPNMSQQNISTGFLGLGTSLVLTFKGSKLLSAFARFWWPISQLVGLLFESMNIEHISQPKSWPTGVCPSSSNWQRRFHFWLLLAGCVWLDWGLGCQHVL